MADEHVSPASAPAPSVATTPASPTPAVAPTPASATPALTTDVILGLIDHLEALLRDAGVSELEVEAGGLGIMLRKPEPLGHVPGAANPAATAKIIVRREETLMPRHSAIRPLELADRTAIPQLVFSRLQNRPTAIRKLSPIMKRR